MTLPTPALPKRRLQILDDETRDAPRFNASAQDVTSASKDIWVRDFIVRLAASVRGLGRKP